MKKLIYSILGALGIIGLLSSGCVTKPTNPTPEQQAAWEQKIKNTALLLENTTYSALVIIHDKNPKEIDNILKYANLAQVAIKTLLDSNNFDPSALQEALKVIPVNEFKSPEAQLIVPAVVSAYTLWLGNSTSTWYNSDKNFVARTLLTGVFNGVDNAYKNLVKVKSSKAAYRSLWTE
jgi:hypothetical protein